jgi:hypothetical protein
VDLALEDAESEEPQSWTESELGRRWDSRWDSEKVHAWLEEAIALDLVEPAQPGTSMDLMYKARLILRRKFKER